MEPSDDIPVTYGDLKELRDTLDTVYHYLFIQDLQKQYLSLSNKVQHSRLSNTVRDHVRRLDNYLEDAENEGEEQDDVQE